jgi:hypothetical protein
VAIALTAAASLAAIPAEEFGMFTPPLSAMLPVLSNNSELNASAPVSLIAFPVQAKHYFTNFVAGLSEPFAAFFAAILKVLPQFLWNVLCRRRRSSYGRAENCQ